MIKSEVFESAVEKTLAGPIFVIDYPASICPLTKRKADNPAVAERFELIVQGMEIANAYTELNDPDLQEQLFKTQLAGLAEEDSMAKMDHDFIRALRHGMPPAGGLGLGIDRLVMLLTNTQSIRDVILFPLLRPEIDVSVYDGLVTSATSLTNPTRTNFPRTGFMYKLLLCWRYLRTRYIALASIISVMLGVATMIVVNAVMEGFTHEMQERIHGILSDLVFESHIARRLPRRRAPHGTRFATWPASTSTACRPRCTSRRCSATRSAASTSRKQITLIGVDEATYATVSDFGQFLQHPDNRKQLDFELKDGGYDTIDHQASRSGESDAAHADARRRLGTSPTQGAASRSGSSRRKARSTAIRSTHRRRRRFSGRRDAGTQKAPISTRPREQHTGCVLGIGLCAYRTLDGADGFLAAAGRRREDQLSHGRPSRPRC